MSKYEVLLNILDRIRSEAPPSYKSYYPLETDTEKLNQARSKAFIHLYLKVKFGLLDFAEREEYITDGSYDGGIDAYYIDKHNRMIHFIQSKFRASEVNFEQKNITVDELLSMDIKRIVDDGEQNDESGNPYNSKIKKLIRRIQEIYDIGRYTYEVVILANLAPNKQPQLKKLIPGFRCSVFDFEHCYEDLVFPVVSGTYYNSSDLFININLTQQEYSSSRISYPVETNLTGCEITILFVPTLEIAKALYKYKNSILRYNPRSYLTLKTNPVNREIARSITERQTNEFSLFNNGITMLSDETRLQEKVAKKSRGQLYVRNPQIINGGQTAYTLSSIYEAELRDGKDPEEVFRNKEVMLKVITFTDIEDSSEGAVLELIEAISKATNQQTPVKEADRRSNDSIQIALQRQIFSDFGYFYERKRGEFHDGQMSRYIEREKIIDRVTFLRTTYAMQGFPARAVISERYLFEEDRFMTILDHIDISRKMFFAYLCYQKAEEIKKKYRRERNNQFGILHYGNALRYGVYAVIYAACALLTESITPDNVVDLVNSQVDKVLNVWLEFEHFATQQAHNKNYFRVTIDEVTGRETIENKFDGYYKGGSLNSDLARFFAIGPP